jgi:hypothetical protein
MNERRPLAFPVVQTQAAQTEELRAGLSKDNGLILIDAFSNVTHPSVQYIFRGMTS